ncbi:MAG TPA: M28 family peptidase [Bryobacteraceae bacterium]|nr:M28 family peptidase [Bryobacteraceae bacterium]
MRFFAAFFAAGLLCAQPPERLHTGYESIQPERLKADLTFLSSDALEGRLSLSRGSEAAIQWIASEFAKAGLKPLVGDSYLQPVPLIEYSPDRALNSLTLTRNGKSETFHAPDATANFAHEVNLSGGVVFAGYGITAPELNYDDYAGIDAHGKIVLIFNHEPQEADPNSVFNGIGNTRYTNNIYKLFNAEKHGAVAVLTMPDPNHQGPVRGGGAAAGQPAAAQAGAGRGGRGQGQGQAAQRPRILPESLVDGGPSIPLFTLGRSVSDALFEAAGKKAADVESAINAKPAPASFEVPGVTLELRTATAEQRRGNSYNVVGLIEGSDPALKAETIVFSGHFDHDGTGPAGIYHGADDNGSGTIGVVALAHAFASNPVKPKRSLLFIVFAAEERGLLGSYYYVSHPLRPLATTRAQINFDMIGRNEAADPRVITQIASDTTNQLGLIGTDYSPDYRETVERQNKVTGLNLTYKWDLDAYNSILFRSDQYPFLLHDVPAIWWFTGFHPDYHQVTDTIEKINFEKMAKILRLAYLSGFEFADEAHTPRLEPRAKAKQ